MINAGRHGAACWVDLSTPEIRGTTSFYAELFGWDVASSPTPVGEYFIGKIGDHQVGGMMDQSPELQGNPALWTTFFYVDNIEATVAEAEQAGGTILEKPFDIPGDARIAIVADPTGAILGLFGGPELGGPYYSRDAGSVCWVELLTRDPVAAQTFYIEVFGWEPETVMASGSAYTMFRLNSEDVAGMMMMPEVVPVEAPAHWAAYFSVDDCCASERRAEELGAQILRVTHEIDIGKFAVIADPNGAPFNLMEFTS